MTIIIMAIASVAGYAAHLLRRYTDSLAHGWRDLSNYAIGIVGAFPFALLFYRSQPRDERDNSNRFIVAYIMAFVSFGAGVVFGWLLDTVASEKGV